MYLGNIEWLGEIRIRWLMILFDLQSRCVNHVRSKRVCIFNIWNDMKKLHLAIKPLAVIEFFQMWQWAFKNVSFSFFNTSKIFKSTSSIFLCCLLGLSALEETASVSPSTAVPSCGDVDSIAFSVFTCSLLITKLSSVSFFFVYFL